MVLCFRSQGTGNRPHRDRNTYATSAGTQPSTSMCSRIIFARIQVRVRAGFHLNQFLSDRAVRISEGRQAKSNREDADESNAFRGKAFQMRFLRLSCHSAVESSETHGSPPRTGGSAIRGDGHTGGSTCFSLVVTARVKWEGSLTLRFPRFAPDDVLLEFEGHNKETNQAS